MGNKGSASLRDTNNPDFLKIDFGPHGTYKTYDIDEEESRANTLTSPTNKEQIDVLERKPEGILRLPDSGDKKRKETGLSQSVKKDRSQSVYSEHTIIGSHLL
uniref:Uncharacterized protein n=1 Tax=Acrobeloides nanus TaxID=290746 RepID=A0A914DXM3_9BILA